MPDKPPLSVVSSDPTQPSKAPPPKKRSARSTWILIIALAALVVGGGLASAIWYLVRGVEDPGRPPSNLPMMSVQSEPAGARVAIDGREVGQTPWFSQNELPPTAEVELTLTLAGHQPWSTKIRGGEEVRVSAELKRRRGAAGPSKQSASTGRPATGGSLADEALEPAPPSEPGRRKPLVAPGGMK